MAFGMHVCFRGTKTEDVKPGKRIHQNNFQTHCRWLYISPTSFHEAQGAFEMAICGGKCLPADACWRRFCLLARHAGATDGQPGTAIVGKPAFYCHDCFAGQQQFLVDQLARGVYRSNGV